jgi:SAM-dependent methyltransferase
VRRAGALFLQPQSLTVPGDEARGVTPEDYESWYETPRGRWISAVEFGLLRSLLDAQPGASILDVGCGTGHFTRLIARAVGGAVVGLDPNEDWLAYARSRATAAERYVTGRAENLPFANASFDCAISVTALCFVADQRAALREMLRVTRRRLVLGLLNRHSLLYLRKRTTAGYRGAHWHTARELRRLFDGLPARGLQLRSAIYLPGGGALARRVETCLSPRWLLGGFLAAAVDPG